MTDTVKIRMARSEEAEWINARYDEVAFQHSCMERDLVMIAEVNGCKAGLARLVKLTDTTAELGGMYVLDNFRGAGLAHQLIQALLQAASAYTVIYCLPFAPLQNLYRRHGFQEVADRSAVPRQILEKHGWCNSFYAGKATLLLARYNPSTLVA